VPKQLVDPNAPKPSNSIMSIDNMSSILIRTDTATAEINDKCYQRWHQVLQEGLVPMSVHALNLLQKSAVAGDEAINDEEEAYIATMEGMDEEIKVMAILARAAALNDILASEANGSKTCTENKDGMEQINAMMKCTAMLLFHIVLAASSPVSSDGSVEENMAKATKNDNSTEAIKTVAGYDGRVRHVMKLACIDVLTRAIIESVESFDSNNNVSIATDEGDQSSGLYDMDEYSLWNTANIKTFLDQTDLGKDAVFGTPFNPSARANIDSGKLLLENGEIKQKQKQEKRQSQSEEDEQSAISGNVSKKPQSVSDEQASNCGGMPPETVDSIGSVDSFDSSSSLEVQSEEIKYPESQSLENIPQKNMSDTDMDGNGSHRSGRRNEEQEAETNSEGKGNDGVIVDFKQSEGGDGKEEQVPETNDRQQQDDEVIKELHSRRHFNAKFLATRKFELIERLVALDVVRFLMAEEREIKIREKELRDQKTSANKLPSFLKKGNNSVGDDSNKEGGTVNLGGSSNEENVDANSEGDEITNSQYFTASRVKSIKRGAKIAGAGLTLGMVFAITGGLAAPALAAGIGSIAALTGATTASSTALLAVLATFKAGAALFGVGGGGLAAYKMKKRTAGLTHFEIRRENIEQYMYPGASDDKMKKGIEAMLPQLHTTVAVTGWLRANDIADFQLAWGVQPTCDYEKEDDDKRRLRQMKRFYSLYNPPLVHLCESFMQTLQKRLKMDFSWDRIWYQLEQKYGANPDHMLPIWGAPHDTEVFLSYEEKEIIDGVLNDAKIVNLKKRGFATGVDIDFNENDEIAELLANVSPKKRPNKSSANGETELDLEAMENEFVMSDLAVEGSDDEVSGLNLSVKIPSDGEEGQIDDRSDEKKTNMIVEESESVGGNLSVKVPSVDYHGIPLEKSPSLQERMAKQRDGQVSFLKSKGVIYDESNLKEGAGSPKMSGADSIHRDDAQDVPVKGGELIEEYDDKRCPIVWDWKRLYGSADIHTVTWEADMLSSLCHIVENMALEVSSQATKVALQYSVIGAIISAIAIPSALITASKLIDDPYQIVVIRADEAGKELAKCLLQSDERRPVTLVGFSFGARVIYSCLRELARQQDLWEENRAPKLNSTAEEKKSSRSTFLSSKKSKEEIRFEYDREPASLVADVVFIGLPRAIDKKVLTSCRRVTGGRLVNCYTRNDWLLSLMFVARGGTPCGIKPIKDVPGVENCDVTSLVESHTKYANAIPSIMQKVRFSEP